MLNDNSDVLDLVSQVEAQILALDYPSKILVAASGRWCRVPGAHWLPGPVYHGRNEYATDYG